MAQRARDGKGHRAYRRKAKALRRQGRCCAWCGKPIDYTLPSTDAMSYTADHPDAVNNGGHLYKQALVPMHRSCNSKKSDSAPIIIRPAQ